MYSEPDVLTEKWWNQCLQEAWPPRKYLQPLAAQSYSNWYFGSTYSFTVEHNRTVVNAFPIVSQRFCKSTLQHEWWSHHVIQARYERNTGCLYHSVSVVWTTTQVECTSTTIDKVKARDRLPNKIQNASLIWRCDTCGRTYRRTFQQVTNMRSFQSANDKPTLWSHTTHQFRKSFNSRRRINNKKTTSHDISITERVSPGVQSACIAIQPIYRDIGECALDICQIKKNVRGKSAPLAVTQSGKESNQNGTAWESLQSTSMMDCYMAVKSHHLSWRIAITIPGRILFVNVQSKVVTQTTYASR